MLDKWLYKIFGAIDDAFCWLDNSVVTISKKWGKFKMIKFFKKIWKKYVDWIWG